MHEYWIGKGVDYDGIWKAYDSGHEYMDKYQSMEVHLIRITLSQQAAHLPLFNHEAVFKTLKGYFHDMKVLCLSPDEYSEAGPLFLYGVDRGSGIWSFLGELRQLILLGTTLADEKVIGQKLENMDKRFDLLRKNFGHSVSTEDFKRFMAAKTPRQLENALQRIIEQGIEKIEISQRPFNGNIKDTTASSVDIKKLLKDADGS